MVEQTVIKMSVPSTRIELSPSSCEGEQGVTGILTSAFPVFTHLITEPIPLKTKKVVNIPRVQQY